MAGIVTFARAHPMGLLLATSCLTLAVVAGLLIGYPIWVDHCVLEDLGSDSPAVRSQAIVQAAFRATIRDRMRRIMIEALDTEDDTYFYAIVSALNTADLFEKSVDNPIYDDRINAVELATAPDPHTRVWLLSQVINSRRDNRYVRQALATAAGDKKAPSVRAGAALLAALLKDDAVLGKLLVDDEPAVRAAAALDAGLAGRRALTDALRKGMKDSNPSVAASAALGLAKLDAAGHGRAICDLLVRTSDTDLRGRLCHVMTVLDDDNARRTIGGLLAAARDARQLPSAMMLVAAGKLGISDAADDIRSVLAAGIKDSSTDRHVVHAAIDAAGLLKVPVRGELYAICRKYWNPDWRAEGMFASAVRLLGVQAADDTGQAADAPTRRQCMKLLANASYYARATTAPARRIRTTPVSSAAASVAYWLLDPSAETTVKLEKVTSDEGVTEFAGRVVSSAKLVMDAARSDLVLAGDYIAWHVGRSGRPEAFKLGLRMLPPRNAPPGKHIYNENLRGAGAMLLAFAARGPQEEQTAIRRISERLEPGPTDRGEDNPVLAGRYRCALFILGKKDLLDAVRRQRSDLGHAVPAAYTALLLSADTEALERLLYNTRIRPRDVATYLIYNGLDRVLDFCAPQLPKIDASPNALIQLWQTRILQDYYVLHRDSLVMRTLR